MRVEKVRIQNFQCISDSADILLDEHITVFVGENESGKSAILKALSNFNQDMTFEDVDISTMSYVRPRLENSEVTKDDIEMVAMWVVLDEHDRHALELAESLATISHLKIVKMLSGRYRILTDDNLELSDFVTKSKTEQIETHLSEIKNKLSRVYCGQIKSKLSGDHYVFLQKQEGEEHNNNVILFEDSAKEIWPELQVGDWLQVTNIAEDPFRRNRRALNAGKKIDLSTSIDNFMEAVKSNADLQAALSEFLSATEEIPQSHPLRDIATPNVIENLKAVCNAPSSIQDPQAIEKLIYNNMPRFVYLPLIDNISDSMKLGEFSDNASDMLLAALIKVAGLKPEEVVRKDHADKIKRLREKSELLSKRLRDYWFNEDIIVDFDFLDQDKSIGIAIDSAGSFDPPSRRSHGFMSFISLFSKLAQLAENENSVVLLDDPAVHLHPVAQKKILRLLESQQYQIVIATHLPFIINPENLERIRVVKRTPAGSQIEHDWDKARHSLLPVWGSLIGSLTGRIWILVEGRDDKNYYTALNAACKKAGLDSLDTDIIIVPAGGNNLPYTGHH